MGETVIKAHYINLFLPISIAKSEENSSSLSFSKYCACGASSRDEITQF